MTHKKEKINTLNVYGLIGQNISYSFSKNYFSEKFQKEEISDVTYQNFDIKTINDFPKIISNITNLKGLNVTIPYKEKIIPFLDYIDETAKLIGAVNTIKIEHKTLKGFNTDEYGFRNALLPYLKGYHKTALILGTGGASKAVAYTLKKLDISYEFVSRKRTSKYTYDSLTKNDISKNLLIINCTPLGTFPDIESKPKIYYDGIGNKHLLFDLIYNPSETAFLKIGKEKGATTINGLKMLKLQAEKAWEIWNS